MWAEPWLGSEEAQMEPDVVAILQKAARRYRGKILQQRAKGPGNAQEGTPSPSSPSGFLFSVRSMLHPTSVESPTTPSPHRFLGTTILSTCHFLIHDANHSLITFPPTRR